MAISAGATSASERDDLVCVTWLQFLHKKSGILGAEAKIVSHHPDPNRITIIAVRGDGANGHAALAGDADVIRWLYTVAADIDPCRSESLLKIGDGRALLELDPKRNTVAMKNRSLDDAQGWHGDAAAVIEARPIQQSGKMFFYPFLNAGKLG